MDEFAIVQDPSGVGWTVHAPSGNVVELCRSQRDALALVRAAVLVGVRARVQIVSVVPSPSVRVVAVRGTAGTSPEARAPAEDEEFTMEDAVAGAGAITARLRGEQFDLDGDGEADGDDVLDRVVQQGPETSSKRVFTAARGWIDVAIMVLGFLGSVIGVPLIAPWIQGGVVGVALSTLALSGGAFLAGMVFLSNRVNLQTREGAIWAALILAGSFLVSSWLAGALGQPAPAVEGPQFVETIRRGFMIGGPPDLRIVAACVAALGFVVFGAADVYGWGGAMFSILCGLLIAWRAVDLWAGATGVAST